MLRSLSGQTPDLVLCRPPEEAPFGSSQQPTPPSTPQARLVTEQELPSCFSSDGTGRDVGWVVMSSVRGVEDSDSAAKGFSPLTEAHATDSLAPVGYVAGAVCPFP